MCPNRLMEVILSVETEPVLAGLRRMIAEEMHLLIQELEDSLEAGQVDRLDHLTKALEEAAELLRQHQAARPA
ncbi:MAG: hypothetical protein GY939_22850 [Actinomycetia bacterium]|nr:hypothetical protein [Actinomycetes bacterium]